MSSSARIEELQKKFDENPRRYFAPLANECRKAGDLDAAIAICRAHLPQQPGHMSGHIVYGQALFEAGELDEARSVFEMALGLDPENLIALRQLGDICARHGDLAGARQWYVRVLETDPRNEEIQALVAGINGGAEPVAADGGGDLPTMMDPALLAAAAEAGEPEAEGGEAAPMRSAAADAPALEQPQPDIDYIDVAPAASLSDTPGSSDDSFALDGFEATSFDLSPRRDSESDARQSPRDPELLDSSRTDDADAFVTETMAELYLQQGYRDRALDVYRQLVAQHPDDAGLRDRMARVEAEGTGVVADQFARETVEVGPGELADEPMETHGDVSPAQPVLPGLPRALDPSLVAAAAERRAGVGSDRAGPTIRDFLSALAAGQPIPAAAEPPSSAPPVAGLPEPEAGGEVAEVVQLADEVGTAPGRGSDAGVTSMFAGVELADAPGADQSRAGSGLDAIFGDPASEADARVADQMADAFLPPGPVAASPAQDEANPLSGRPARPAGNDLSLDHVFGQPRQRGGGNPTGGFSFDQFFAEDAVRTSRDEAPPPAAEAGSGEDIEQFNSWLKGLKHQ